MRLIVGLGNPGEKYQNTRHNLGWWVVDELGESWVEGDESGCEGGKWVLNKKIMAEYCQSEKGVVLAKPTTFMNNSGVSVKKLITHFHIPITNLWLIHDDLDLPLEKLKIVQNRGSAGHRGVLSVIRQLGTINFVRFRLGISHPQRSRKKVGGKKVIKYDSKEDLEEFVLSPFLPTEKDEVKSLIEKTVKAINVALKQGIEAAMNQYN